MDHIIIALCTVAAAIGIVALFRRQPPPVKPSISEDLLAQGASLCVKPVIGESEYSFRKAVIARRNQVAKAMVKRGIQRHRGQDTIKPDEKF